MNKTLKKNSSFTLIELLVVIVIIGILAGLVTIAATSFINNSHNARMVAELAGISKKLIGETEFPAGNFCMEDGSSEAKKLLDFLEMEKAPKHPLYNGGTHLTTNECFLYFSDGEHYSIRVPTVGNKGYLIQESRNPNPQGIQEKCEEGWIPFGNRCVMKYEAKYDADKEQAVSKATSIPWTKETAGTEVEDYLTWYKAKEECEKIGAHLITNAEWMALARDIESVDENWVGTGTDRALKMGNTGNAAPVNSDAWYALDSADYVGHPDPNDKADRSSTSSAKLILSNGQVIWDLSGNVSEWIDKIISTQKGLIGSGNYVEINSIDWANLTNMHISYSQIGPLDKNGDNFTSSNGIGTICLSSSEGCFALARGATHINKKNTGVFTFYFKDLPSTSLDTRGFRCVR